MHRVDTKPMDMHVQSFSTAIQCLGIKPKAINDSCIKDTERNGI